MTTVGDGGRDIFGFRPGVDETPVPLVVSQFDERVATLSPDGRWMAYESTETGRNEVFVRPFPDTDTNQWRVSTDGGKDPLWSRGGGELFYVNGEREMVAAEVVTAPGFAVGDQTVLFPVAPYGWRGDGSIEYDVSLDDRRFLMVGNAGTRGGVAESSLIRVENWFEELKARVPTGQ